MRPEYIQALEAARWNHWLYVMFIVPAILIWVSMFIQKEQGLIYCAACFICWVSFAMWVGTYWETKSRMAVTDLEWQDVTADTGRLYGPGFVGIPFTLIYCSAHAAVASCAPWTYRLVFRRVEKANDGIVDGYDTVFWRQAISPTKYRPTSADLGRTSPIKEADPENPVA